MLQYHNLPLMQVPGHHGNIVHTNVTVVDHNHNQPEIPGGKSLKNYAMLWENYGRNIRKMQKA